jgi:hypothetical protein
MGIVGELFQDQGLLEFTTYSEACRDAWEIGEEPYDFSEFKLWSDENKETIEQMRDGE